MYDTRPPRSDRNVLVIPAPAARQRQPRRGAALADRRLKRQKTRQAQFRASQKE